MALKNRPLGRIDGQTNYATYEFVAANGVTINEGDFVYFDGDGEVTNASIGGARLVGMALQTVAGNDDRKVLVCIDPMMRYLIDNDIDSTTFAASHVGDYFDLIGAAGAQLVDTSSTSNTTGQLVCLEYNPKVDPVSTDTSWGVFKIAESFLSPLGS
jgi:hypothetical protein